MNFRLIILFIFIVQSTATFSNHFHIPSGDTDSLRAAIEIANSNGDNDTIYLAPKGIYIIGSNYVDPDGMLMKDLGLPSIYHDPGIKSGPDLVIFGAASTLMRSTQSGTPEMRATTVEKDTKVEFHDLNFQNFQITSRSSLHNQLKDGAVIKAEDFLDLSFFHCSFENNRQYATGRLWNTGGGAITAFRGGMLIFKHCIFNQNKANYGGALYLTRTSIKIDSCIFKENGTHASPVGLDGGGAIRFHLFNESKVIKITSTTFDGNYTYREGGAINGRIGNKNRLFVVNCIFRNNISSSAGIPASGNGGGIRLQVENDSSQAFFTNTSFHHNRAEINGGALVLKGNTIFISNVTIAFNKAVDKLGTSGTGGGLYSEDGIGINHSTIAYNHAGEYGGGIKSKATTRIKNSLIVANTANNAMGIRQNAVSTTALTGEEVSAYFIDEGNNLEYPPIDIALGDNGYASTSGHEYNLDPHLSDTLTYLCGAMPVLALAAGSPAIDRIPKEFDVDQLFNRRGTNSDIGAFEFQEGSIPAINISQDPENTPTRGLPGNDLVGILSETDPITTNPSYRWFVSKEPLGVDSPDLFLASLPEGSEVYVQMTPAMSEACPTHSPVQSRRLIVRYNEADSLSFGSIDADRFWDKGKEGIKIGTNFKISNLSFIKNITFEYKGIGDDSWNKESLGNDFQNKFVEISTQAEWFDELGLEYRFVGTNISDLADTTATSYSYIRHTGEGIELGNREDFSFGDEESNYHMISVPLLLKNPQISSVLEDDLDKYPAIKWRRKWRIFHYDNGYKEYTDGLSEITPGKSYFLIMKKEEVLKEILDSGEGSTLEVSKTTPYSISLKKGFNQIASPYPFDVSWQEIREANPMLLNELPQNLLGYDGSWSPKSILPAYSGVFITVNKPGSLLIPVKKNGKKKQGNLQLTNSIDQENWEVYFELKNNKQRYNLGAFGMNSDATIGHDSYDIATPPRFSNYLEMSYIKENARDLKLSKNIVAPARQYTWEFQIETTYLNDLTTLHWENEYFGNSGMQLWLFDQERQKIIDMRQNKVYSFFPRESGNKFKVYYGARSTLLSLVQPQKTFLGIPHPHPVQGASSIPFTLTHSAYADIQLNLYDLTGRKLAVVFDEKLKAGFHEIVWNTASNSKYPAGTYMLYLMVNQKPMSHQKIVIQP